MREWANATTRRDVAELARINLQDRAIQAGFETFYDGNTTDGIEMVEVLPYFDNVEQAGDVWLVTGATFAHDRDATEQRGIRTNFNCIVWTVDLAAGTATFPNPQPSGTASDTWIPELDFPEQFRTHCA